MRQDFYLGKYGRNILHFISGDSKETSQTIVAKKTNQCKSITNYIKCLFSIFKTGDKMPYFTKSEEVTNYVSILFWILILNDFEWLETESDIKNLNCVCWKNMVLFGKYYKTYYYTFAKIYYPFVLHIVLYRNYCY